MHDLPGAGSAPDGALTVIRGRKVANLRGVEQVLIQGSHASDATYLRAGTDEALIYSDAFAPRRAAANVPLGRHPEPATLELKR